MFISAWLYIAPGRSAQTRTDPLRAQTFSTRFLGWSRVLALFPLALSRPVRPKTPEALSAPQSISPCFALYRLLLYNLDVVSISGRGGRAINMSQLPPDAIILVDVDFTCVWSPTFLDGVRSILRLVPYTMPVYRSVSGMV